MINLRFPFALLTAAAFGLGAIGVADSQTVPSVRISPTATTITAATTTKPPPITTTAPPATVPLTPHDPPPTGPFDFNLAYQAAVPGAIIPVPAGTYLGQTIDNDPSKVGCTNPVIFQAAGQVNVTGDLQIRGDCIGFVGNGTKAGGSNFTVRQIIYQSLVPGGNEPSALIVRGLHVKAVACRSCDDLTIEQTELGPNLASAPPPIYQGFRLEGFEGHIPNNITLQDSWLHDINSANLDAFHTECAAFFAGTNVMILRNKWERCAVFDIFLQPAAYITPLLIEGNEFGCPVLGAAQTGGNGQTNATCSSNADVEFDTTPDETSYRDVTIRNNAWTNGPAWTSNRLNGGLPSFMNVTVSGNTALKTRTACFAAQGLVWSANVWNGLAKC